MCGAIWDLISKSCLRKLKFKANLTVRYNLAASLSGLFLCGLAIVINIHNLIESIKSMKQTTSRLKKKKKNLQLLEHLFLTQDRGTKSEGFYVEERSWTPRALVVVWFLFPVYFCSAFAPCSFNKRPDAFIGRQWVIRAIANPACKMHTSLAPRREKRARRDRVM